MAASERAWRILIDIREMKLQAAFRFANEFVPLDLGDVQFVEAGAANDAGDAAVEPSGFKHSRSECVRFICERKTLADLTASIRDGRFSEQRERLQAFANTQPDVVIAYIIEGLPSDPSQLSALIGLQMRQKWVVIHTSGIAGTVAALERFYTKLQNGDWTSADSGLVFATSRAPRKRDNYDAKAIWISQIACIPKISLQTAAAIADRWPSLAEFQAGASLALIAAIKPKQRAIGKAAAAAVYECFGQTGPCSAKTDLRRASEGCVENGELPERAADTADGTGGAQ